MSYDVNDLRYISPRTLDNLLTAMAAKAWDEGFAQGTKYGATFDGEAWPPYTEEEQEAARGTNPYRRETE